MMFRYVTGSRFLLLCAHALASLTHAPTRERFRREVGPRLRSIRHRADRGPNGRSWRSLKRAVNAGWTPKPPSRDEMERHAWFRNKLAAARLRIHVGQELPGDRALLDPGRLVPNT